MSLVLLSILAMAQASQQPDDRVRSLIELSRSADPALRCAAIKALYFEADPRAGSRIYQLCDDTDLAVKFETVLLVNENDHQPALHEWRRTMQAEAGELSSRLHELDETRASRARERLARLRLIITDSWFIDRERHIGALGTYGRMLAPGGQYVRVFKVLLKHLEMTWLSILYQPTCGTIAGTRYDSFKDVVAMYHKSPATIDEAMWNGWNDSSSMATIALAMSGSEQHIQLLEGMAGNSSDEWRMRALATLPLINIKRAAAAALPILKGRHGEVRAVAALALLAADPVAHFKGVKEALLADAKAAKTYMVLAQWQFSDFAGTDVYVTFRRPKVSGQEMAELAEQCAVRHDAFYAPQVIAAALGKDAIPILKRIRDKVSPTVREQADYFIAQLKRDSSH